MRIESFGIRNYKGIAFARIDGLASEPIVTISGRNGTGKSLVLEALVSAWRDRYNMADRVGPWGDDLTISISVSFAENEWAALDDWHRRFGAGGELSRENPTLEVTWNRVGQKYQTNLPALELARGQAFQREHPFGIIDFLSANRLVSSAPTPTVDLAMLGSERVEQDRNQMLDQFIQHRSAMALPSVSNYLVTLDYQNFLAERQKLPASNEYEEIATAFESATGKTLMVPQYDPIGGSNISVSVPGGHSHGLDALSSGEQEMLAMMYFVRRLSASGGVLCIDEPEQHLHPTLQSAVFESMSAMSERAQVIVVSHSVNIIAAAPMRSLVELAAPEAVTTNQLSRLNDHPERTQLVAELGITAADIAQNDLLLVVEGDTDSRWLQMVFPVELGRAFVMIAGSAKQVMDAHKILANAPAGIPWLCVRDRDLMTDSEVADLKDRYPRLFVWPRRAIESEFIDTALISATYAAIGSPHSEQQVEAWLTSAAGPLRDDVLESLVARELSRTFPGPGPQTGSRFQKMEQNFRAYSMVNADRASAVSTAVESQREALDRRWAADWRTLVDPKRLLAAFVVHAGTFRNYQDLVGALAAKARDDSNLRPPTLEALRDQIAKLLAR
jgi:predicted ATPase